MAERVVVIQKSDFRTVVQAPPANKEDGPLQAVKRLHELTPYGMMLAGLGSCTAIVLNTFAGNHGVHLEEVEVRLSYQRDYQKDCQECEVAGPYTEHIVKEVVLRGDLDESTRLKLFRISRACPIYKILSGGIRIESHLGK